MADLDIDIKINKVTFIKRQLSLSKSFLAKNCPLRLNNQTQEWKCLGSRRVRFVQKFCSSKNCVRVLTYRIVQWDLLGNTNNCIGLEKKSSKGESVFPTEWLRDRIWKTGAEKNQARLHLWWLEFGSWKYEGWNFFWITSCGDCVGDHWPCCQSNDVVHDDYEMVTMVLSRQLWKGAEGPKVHNFRQVELFKVFMRSNIIQVIEEDQALLLWLQDLSKWFVCLLFSLPTRIVFSIAGTIAKRSIANRSQFFRTITSMNPGMVSQY